MKSLVYEYLVRLSDDDDEMSEQDHVTLSPETFSYIFYSVGCNTRYMCRNYYESFTKNQGFNVQNLLFSYNVQYPTHLTPQLPLKSKAVHPSTYIPGALDTAHLTSMMDDLTSVTS